MPNWGMGAKGAVAGGAAGSSFGPVGIGIGAAAGGLAGLFGGSDDSMSDAERAKILELYQGYLNSLPGGPNANPAETGALNRLEQQSKTGVTPEIMLQLLQSRMEADRMANGRESAIREREAMMGRGVANSGQSAIMQQQAAQDGATRAQSGGMQIGAIANQGQRAALDSFLAQLNRNNAMRFQATQGLAGAHGMSMQYEGAKSAAHNQMLGDAMNTAGAAGMYAWGKQQPGARPSGDAFSHTEQANLDGGRAKAMAQLGTFKPPQFNVTSTPNVQPQSQSLVMNNGQPLGIDDDDLLARRGY